MGGGSILGAGMALSGACPGTVFPQIGTDPGVRVGLIVAGGVTAVLLFGYMHKRISDSYECFLEKVPDVFRGKQTILNGLSMAAVLSIIAVIALLNYLFPWESEMEIIVGENLSASSGGDSELGIWDPVYAGVLVGALQLLSFLSNGSALGMSTGWLFPAYCIAKIFDKNVAQNAPYLLKYSSWQAVCAIGAILGSYLSSSYLNTSGLSAEALAFQSDDADVYARSFFGGFFILLGARIGNGCTSGHGLSGVALMSMGSMISVAFMFLGGLIASALFYPN